MNSVVEILNSQASFLLVRTNQSSLIYKRLLEAGIVVRDRSSVLHCHGCLRVTVGTTEENDKLIESWGNLQ